MKKIILFCLVALCTMSAMAQGVEGAVYMLPMSGVKVTMLVEKRTFTPGNLAPYAYRYLLDNEVSTQAQTEYRIVSTRMTTYAMPDTSKVFTAHVDSKHNFNRLALSDDGILLAINTDAKQLADEKVFVASPAVKPLDYRRYLNQDILSSGSKMKMAQLVAKEIYDIRESRHELSSGQADYMPKDGEQLRLMFQSLDEKEAALRQMFEGFTQVDTTEVTMEYMPMKEGQDVLFRLSPSAGVVSADGSQGTPYYIKVTDLHSAPQPIVDLEGKKAPKDDTGIWINLPGKIRVSLIADGKVIDHVDYGAGQFGTVENLNEPLFSKKVLTKLVLNPISGGLDNIESNPIK